MIAPVSRKRRDGRSSFQQLAQYILEKVDPLTGERQLCDEFLLADDLMMCSETPEEAVRLAATFMHATAMENKLVDDPIFHFQLTWPSGEVPAREQWEDATRDALSELRYPIGNRDDNVWGSYAEHQFIAGVHRDTDFFHVHVMVNKVHPLTLRSRTPDYYKLALAKSCRESEHKHGWQESPGAFRWDPDLNIAVEIPREERNKRRKEKERNGAVTEVGAGATEYYSGTESAIGFIRRHVSPAVCELLKQDEVTWANLHALLAEHGLEMHKGENGGYTVEQVTTGVSVRASKVFRDNFAGKVNRQTTEAKLGKWVSMSSDLRIVAEAKGPLRLNEQKTLNASGVADLGTGRQTIAASGRAQRDNLQRHERKEARDAGRKALKAEYAKYQEHCYQQSRVLAIEYMDKRKAIREELKERKKVIRSYELSWTEKRAMLAEATQEAITALQVMKYELARKQAEVKAERFEQWVSVRAQGGDPRAVAQVRGWRYQDRRNLRRMEQAIERGNADCVNITATNATTLEEIDWYRLAQLQRQELGLRHQRELAEAFGSIRRSVDVRTGDVSFVIAGRTAVIDRGKLLSVVDNSEAGQVFAIEMAVQKFGHTLTATGNSQWREMIARTAARNGIKVTFADPEMNKVMADEASKTARSRDLFDRSRTIGQYAKALESGQRIVEISNDEMLREFLAGAFSHGRTLSQSRQQATIFFNECVEARILGLHAGKSLVLPNRVVGCEISAHKSATGSVSWKCVLPNDASIRSTLGQRLRSFEARLYNAAVKEMERKQDRNQKQGTDQSQVRETGRSKNSSLGR